MRRPLEYYRIVPATEPVRAGARRRFADEKMPHTSYKNNSHNTDKAISPALIS